MPEETVLSGAPRRCPTCSVDVLERVSAGAAVQTWCRCGPYSRESAYAPEPLIAAVVNEYERIRANAPANEWGSELYGLLERAGLLR